MVGATKRCTPAAALQQAAASKLQEQLEGRLQVFTYGSVMPDGTAAAACVIPSKAISRQCRLPFPASSTAAELAGLHLAADAEDIPAVPIAVLCDGKAALQTLANHRRAGLTGNLLETKFRVLTASGASVSFHWLPSHVGIAGDEEADRLSTPARHHLLAGPPQELLAGPPQEAPRHNPPGPEGGQQAGTKASPIDGPTRREPASLLRLRTGCVWTAARRYLKGRCASPACSRCGDPETLEHLLCTCPGLAKERSTVTTAYTGGRAFLPLPWSTSSSHPVPIYQRSGAWRISSRRRESRPTTETGALAPPPPILAAGLLLFVLMTSVPPHL
ncbi:hypothetical protein HPB52_016001 [Rhipicephalus sanguineus]|uniref:Tick transposon n=1 Tax=Rhipicephalus sanguineus TaxID=34632 RepID=A0A9D4PPJ2_RHISA|nr:hypothetical protein HPB52_016001 [Rhipicephalus sanguineus]